VEGQVSGDVLLKGVVGPHLFPFLFLSFPSYDMNCFALSCAPCHQVLPCYRPKSNRAN
jgi:hypothetical protein